MASRTRRSPTRDRAAGQDTDAARIARVFDAAKFGGKWVASRRGDIVAVADGLAELDAQVRELGLQGEVVLTRIPAKGDFAH